MNAMPAVSPSSMGRPAYAAQAPTSGLAVLPVARALTMAPARTVPDPRKPISRPRVIMAKSLALRIRGAGLDWWMLLQAGLERTDDLDHRVGNPRVLGADVALLSQVGEQVDDLRQRKPCRRVIHVLL